jgi:hypothetical protein
VRVDVGGAEAEWLLVEDVFARPQRAWHVVLTYDDGDVTVYVDGERRAGEEFAGADVSGWSRDYPLVVGNEVTRDRPFRGDVYLVAVYDRALPAREVAQNHDAGLRFPQQNRSPWRPDLLGKSFLGGSGQPTAER